MEAAEYLGLMQPGKCLLSQKEKQGKESKSEEVGWPGYVTLRARVPRRHNSKMVKPTQLTTHLRLRRRDRCSHRQSKHICFPELLQGPSAQDSKIINNPKKGCGGWVMAQRWNTSLWWLHIKHCKKVKGEKRKYSTEKLGETAPVFLELLCKVQRSFSVTTLIKLDNEKVKSRPALTDPVFTPGLERQTDEHLSI